MGFFSSITKAFKKAIKKVTGRDARDKAKEEAARQEAEYQAKLKKQKELEDQQHNKDYGNDADISGLDGLGDYAADSGSANGLTGLGGADTDDLKLQKKKLLGA